MTNQQYLEQIQSPEDRFHVTAMKFYSCFTAPETWPTWLDSEYDPKDPAWLHLDKNYCEEQYKKWQRANEARKGVS